MDGLPFQIDGEAILYGQSQARSDSEVIYTEILGGIRIGRTFDELHLIDAARWPDIEGQTIARIRLNYANGTSNEFPIVYGGHVRDWQRLRTEETELLTDHDSKIFWRGPGISSLKSTTRLFTSTLQNPYPHEMVESMDVISTRNRAAYVLIAATVADHDPRRAITPPLAADEPDRSFDGKLVIRVVDDATGQPIQGALVNSSITIDDVGVVASPFYTSAAGEGVIGYPRGRSSDFRISVTKNSYPQKAMQWSEDIPDSYTFRLKPAIGDEKVKAIIDRALVKYRALKTYQDKASVRFEIVAKKADGEDAGQLSEQSAELAFAKPNRIAFSSQSFSVYSDGEHLWTYMPLLEQYIERPVPQTLSRLDVSRIPLAFMIDSHPVALMLTQPEDDFSQLFPSVQELKGVVAETRKGEPGHRVLGTLTTGGSDTNQPVQIVSFWFSDVSGLLREMRVDFTEFYRHSLANSPMNDEDNKPPKIEKAEVVLSLDDVVLDADVPAKRFTFKPESDSKKVAKFDLGRPEESRQMELVGKPAPEISGTDLEGKPVSLSSLRGRVVLLDFWAMWCGPCVQAIPHVQKIAGTVADKPVTLLGINLDAKGSDQKLKKFLEKRKITIPQFLDPDSNVSKKYRVNGVPCTVLIGTNGVIQAIEVGLRSDAETYFPEQIGRLLKGETLFDEKEIAARPTTPEEPELTESSTVSSNTVLEEIAGERFEEQPQITGQFMGSAYQTRRIDINGDGRSELVLPEWGRGLAIISADGSQVQHLLLKGLGQNANLSSFEPVHLAGKLHWLVTITRWSGSPGNGQKSSANLYNAEGNRVWSYRPAIADNLSCDLLGTAGDLVGNGQTEFVVGIRTYKLHETGAHSYTQQQVVGYLAVLDGSGTLVSLHRIGQGVELIQVAPASEPGKPATILCEVNGRLRRFQFRPPSAVGSDSRKTVQEVPQ